MKVKDVKQVGANVDFLAYTIFTDVDVSPRVKQLAKEIIDEAKKLKWRN